MPRVLLLVLVAVVAGCGGKSEFDGVWSGPWVANVDGSIQSGELIILIEDGAVEGHGTNQNQMGDFDIVGDFDADDGSAYLVYRYPRATYQAEGTFHLLDGSIVGDAVFKLGGAPIGTTSVDLAPDADGLL